MLRLNTLATPVPELHSIPSAALAAYRRTHGKACEAPPGAPRPDDTPTATCPIQCPVSSPRTPPIFTGAGASPHALHVGGPTACP